MTLDQTTPAAFKHVQVPMHWLLRTVAVLTGLLFFLFGSLAFLVSLTLPPAANAAANPGAELTARIITVVIMGGVALFGVFLIWVGMRRTSRLVILGSRGPESFVTQPGTDKWAPPEVPEFGKFITQCGPQQAGLTNYLVFGGAMLILALLCFLAPSTFLVPKPGDEAAIRTVAWISGGLSVLFGIGMLWKPLFGQNQMIFLYERGIVERVGAINCRIPLDAIEQLRVQEWYDHRFAPRTYNVRAKVRGQKELSFNSALRGESERIIAYLTERVQQTEMVPFRV